MAPRRSAAIAVALLALGGAKAASAANAPSDRHCLLAWNAADNAAARRRAVAERPRRALLHPGIAFTLKWRRGSPPRQTGGPACLLALVWLNRIQTVTGPWDDGRVARWSFGRRVRTTNLPRGANVRLLLDGRVTKIYRR